MSDVVTVARSTADFIDQKRKTAALVPGVITVRMDDQALGAIVEALRLAADEAEREHQRRTTNEMLYRLALDTAVQQRLMLDLLEASPMTALFWYFSRRLKDRVRAWRKR